MGGLPVLPPQLVGGVLSHSRAKDEKEALVCSFENVRKLFFLGEKKGQGPGVVKSWREITQIPPTTPSISSPQAPPNPFRPNHSGDGVLRRSQEEPHVQPRCECHKLFTRVWLC